MRTRYRLRDKKRFAAILMFLTLVIMFTGLMVNAGAASQGEPHYQSVFVAQGDTLWEIATKYGNNRDPRAYIYELKQLNGIQNDNIFVGQELLLPN